MERRLQIVCYVSCLAWVYVVGTFVAEMVWQSREYWTGALNGRPLAALTNILTANHRPWPYVIAFPWLMLVGVPLVTTRGEISYWDLRRFYLRLITFVVLEVMLLTIALVVIFAPALQILKSLPPPPAEFDLVVVITQWTFWLVALVIMWRAVTRWWYMRQQTR